VLAGTGKDVLQRSLANVWSHEFSLDWETPLIIVREG